MFTLVNRVENANRRQLSPRLVRRGRYGSGERSGVSHQVLHRHSPATIWKGIVIPSIKYDIIGDIHCCASLLTNLLDRLGYRIDDLTGAYSHSERQAIFVGDLIDRGAEQLRVLDIVKRMVDTGKAQIVMGNHEFNAVAYDIECPDRPGEFLRPHSEKNNRQHQAFLDQIGGDTKAAYLQWFATMPLWLDLGVIRVVHACWHEPSMRVVEKALGSNHFSSPDQFVRASDKGDALYDAIEVLLKGPEIDITGHGLPPYYDKDKHARTRARVAWWQMGATTLRELAVMDGNFKTVDGEPYPQLPDLNTLPAESAFSYRDDVPVFYGHYWRSGQPEDGHDYTASTACVDFSAIKTGNLMAYRWEGERQILPDHYICATPRA